MGAAVPRRPRHALKLWHRWFGLIAGLWLLLLAVTGSAIAYYDALDIWLNPDLRTVPATVTRAAPIDDALAAAQRELPGFAPTMIQLPVRAGETLWMLGRAPVDGAPTPVQVFADPRDARILGWRESGRVALDRRHLMDLLYGLHIDLLAGEWMTWFFGLVSLMWVVDHVVAIILSFPRGARGWAALRVAGARASLRRLYDSHRAPGLWFAPVTLVLAVTGVTLAWPETSRNAIRGLSPVTERLHESMAEIEVEAPPMIGIDAAIRRVVGDGGARLHSVRLIPDHGVYGVRSFDERDLDDQGRLWTYVAMADGQILGRRHDNGSTGADSFFAWQYPLHSGKAFGWFGQALVLLAGVVTSWLCISGIKLWWHRRRHSR